MMLTGEALELWEEVNSLAERSNQLTMDLLEVHGKRVDSLQERCEQLSKLTKLQGETVHLLLEGLTTLTTRVDELEEHV